MDRTVVLPTTFHAYVNEGVPPSASVADPEQVKVLSLTTPVAGEIDTPVMVGARLSKVRSTDFVVVPPSVSDAFAVHRMVSLGDAVAADSTSVLVAPSVVPCVSFVHAYVMVGTPPSKSVAFTTQVNVLSLYSAVEGRISILSMTGSVLPTVTAADPVPLPPSKSVAVARHSITSPGALVPGVSASVLVLPNTALPLVHL